ncbi:MAG TPA: tetratricopeptide repeat protein [Candidatus Saccharimonadales bacterium]|nr:tetratricopeptide repeat protein [Candidatus Saccharimonadales bacterium]
MGRQGPGNFSPRAGVAGRQGRCPGPQRRPQRGFGFSDVSIEEQADTPHVWLARGDVLLARKEARADYCFEKALRLAPGNWVILWLAVRVRFYHGQFAAALHLAQQAIGRDAGHFVLWLEQGRCQDSLGLVEAAQDSFARALELDPGCLTATEGLAHLRSHSIEDRVRGWWRRFKK